MFRELFGLQPFLLTFQSVSYQAFYWILNWLLLSIWRVSWLFVFIFLLATFENIDLNLFINGLRVNSVFILDCCLWIRLELEVKKEAKGFSVLKWTDLHSSLFCSFFMRLYPVFFARNAQMFLLNCPPILFDTIFFLLKTSNGKNQCFLLISTWFPLMI